MVRFSLADSIVTIVVIIVLIGGLSIYTNADEQPVTIEMKPASNTIISGGPCILNFTFTSITNSAVTFDLGYDRVGGFHFEILNNKGETVITTSKISEQGGISFIKPYANIEAGGILKEEKLLNKWCSTLLPEGKYTIISHFESITGRRASLLLKLTSTCQIEILPFNKQNQKKLEKVFSDLLDKAITDTDETTISLDEQIFACEQLIYSTSPLVVPYLVKFLAANSTYAIEIIEGFRRVGTVEAAKELVKIMKGKTPPNLSEESFKEKVALEIFRISDISKDPEVIKVCKEITTTMPRPKERQIGD